jgi:hypothetical protein
VALVFAALLSTPASAMAAATLGLSAGTFKFTLNAGKQVEGEVIVMNDGDQLLHVMVYASDQKIDDKGNITYIAPTHADLSSNNMPSSWTSVKMPANSKSLGNVPYLDLAPGARVPVKFSVLVPADVPPGDHNVVLFFESFQPPKKDQGTQSIVSGRLGARVTLRVNGPLREKLEISPFVVPSYVIGEQVPWEFTVRNEGNVDERVGGRIRLFDSQDTELTRDTALDGLRVYAGQRLEATGTINAKDRWPGAYKVRLDVSPVDDAGKATNAGADTITVDRTVYIVPVWAIIAVAVILVVLLGILAALIGRSNRRRRQRIADEAYRRGLSDSSSHHSDEEWDEVG